MLRQVFSTYLAFRYVSIMTPSACERKPCAWDKLEQVNEEDKFAECQRVVDGKFVAVYATCIYSGLS